MATYSYGYTLTWPGAGSPGRNVWHFRTDILAGAQDCVDVIDAFYTAVLATNALAPPYGIRGDEQAIDVATQEIEPITPLNLLSSGPAVEYNPTGQIVCTKRTSSATRSGRGRVFLGPVRSSVTDVDGTPDTALLASLQTACNNLVSASAGLDGAAIGVYSKESGIFRDLIALQARDYMAVLRSRRD